MTTSPKERRQGSEDVVGHHVGLYARNSSTAELILVKFGMNLMPFEVTPSTYF
jgi:hypothetical protein